MAESAVMGRELPHLQLGRASDLCGRRNPLISLAAAFGARPSEEEKARWGPTRDAAPGEDRGGVMLTTVVHGCCCCCGQRHHLHLAAAR